MSFVLFRAKGGDKPPENEPQARGDLSWVIVIRGVVYFVIVTVKGVVGKEA